MRNVISIGFICVVIGLLTQCTEDAFYEGGDSYHTPADLAYMDVVNARENSFIQTGKPTVDTDNLFPSFELVKVTDGKGNELSGEYISSVSIEQPVEVIKNLEPDYFYVENGDTVKTYKGVNSRNAGRITIAEGNPYGIGDYYFTIKVKTTTPDGVELSKVFENVFKLNVGPELVENLLYWPIAQNLVAGGDPSGKAFALNGNSDISFELLNLKDTLTIDSKTGVISIDSKFTVNSRIDVYPQVQVKSNISGETTVFSGKDFLMLALSVNPVTDLPKVDVINFYYPTFAKKNGLYGYTFKVIRPGSIKSWNIFKTSGRGNSFPGAVDERPEKIKGSVKAVENNATAGECLPFEGFMVVNPVDLTLYKRFNQKVVFYIQNRYVEYLDDGTTPTKMLVKISSDYSGDVNKASWTDVNAELECAIENKPNDVFTGMPYPGDQKGDNPDGLKDPSRNADGKWVKCTLDLDKYNDAKRFTIAFHYNSYYTGSIKNNAPVNRGRPGTYYVSDVHFFANVK